MSKWLYIAYDDYLEHKLLDRAAGKVVCQQCDGGGCSSGKGEDNPQPMLLISNQAGSFLRSHKSCCINTVEEVVQSSVDSWEGSGHWTTKVKATKTIQ